MEECIPGRYEWLGRVPDSGLNELYNKAYCLFYPSSYEGFGIPVAEAMRSGCPVVAVDTSSIPEVAGDAALLVKEATVDAFRAAFTQLESDALRKKLIADGLVQAKKFSWEKCYPECLVRISGVDGVKYAVLYRSLRIFGVCQIGNRGHFHQV